MKITPFLVFGIALKYTIPRFLLVFIVHKALEETELIMQKLRYGKRKGYTDTSSIFDTLNS